MFYVEDFEISQYGKSLDFLDIDDARKSKNRFMSRIYFSNERQLLEFVQSAFDELGDNFYGPSNWSSLIGLLDKGIFNCSFRKGYKVEDQHTFQSRVSTRKIYYTEFVELTMAFTCAQADVLKDNPPLAIVDDRYTMSVAYEKHLNSVRQELRNEVVNAFYTSDLRYGKE